jgi:hypothetical protein
MIIRQSKTQTTVRREENLAKTAKEKMQSCKNLTLLE